MLCSYDATLDSSIFGSKAPRKGAITTISHTPRMRKHKSGKNIDLAAGGGVGAAAGFSEGVRLETKSEIGITGIIKNEKGFDIEIGVCNINVDGVPKELVSGIYVQCQEACAKDKSELEIGKIERVMNVLEANDLGGLEVGSYNPDVIFIPEPPHLISVAQHRGDGVLAKPEGTAVSGRRGARHRR